MSGGGRTRWLPRRWRSCAVAAVLASGTLLTVAVRADDVTLPAAKQMALLAKVADYDRNFRARAGASARIALLVKKGDGDSIRNATQMQTALSHIDTVAGLPHEESIEPYTGAEALAAEIRDRHLAIVIVGPGFRNDVEAIRRALEGVDVLSVSAVPDYVPMGIVLGFDLVGGRPKMLLNLTQARSQHVAFAIEVLPLMQVFK